MYLAALVSWQTHSQECPKSEQMHDLKGLIGFDRASRWMFTTKASGAFTFGLKPSETVNANALTIAQNAIAKAAASAKNAVAQEGAFA